MSLETGSFSSDAEADRYCCMAAIGFDLAFQRGQRSVQYDRQDQEEFDLLSERRSPWMRTRFERERAAFFQRACRKRVAALRAVDEMNVIRIDR